MKKILIFITLALCGSQLKAQSPYLDPAIDEELYPAALSWTTTKRFLTHSAANAFGGYNSSANPGPTDIYTYSWDEWDPDPAVAALNFAGFAIKEMNQNDQIGIGLGTSALYEDYYDLGAAGLVGPGGYTVSVEASFIRDVSTGDGYVAVTYYRKSGSYPPGYFLELFEWSGGTLTPVGITKLSEPYFGAIDKGIIHHDIQRANTLVLTFELGGALFTQSVRIASGTPVLSGLGKLDFGPAMTRPDVAMSSLSGAVMGVFYVANDISNQRLYVLASDLATIDAIPAGSLTAIPVDFRDVVTVWDMFGTPATPAYFDLPRIDAPDRSPSGEETWSWVVSEHGGDRDHVRSGYYNRAVSSTVRHDYLNRSVNFPTYDNSLNMGNMTPPLNQRAVVAFGPAAEVYYAWVYATDPSAPPLYSPLASNTGYISHKLDQFGNCLNTFVSGGLGTFYGYDKVNYNTDNPGVMASVALGSSELNLDRLFSSFVLGDISVSAYGYQIGHKTTNWTTAQFRPGTTSIEDNKNAFAFKALPNPFWSNVQLDLTGISPSEQLNLKVFNLSGQTVLTTEGYPDVLNKVVKEHSDSWNAGLYMIQISGKSGTAIQKVIKQ